MRENVAGPIFALVLVGNIARFATKTVVTIAQTIETNSVDAGNIFVNIDLKLLVVVVVVLVLA